MKGNKNMGTNMDSNMAIQQMLSKVHLCKKCTAKIQKYLKTQKGGNCGCGQSGGGGCGCDQLGGAKRRTRKMKMKGKKMKGGDSEGKESYIDFPGKDGLEELDEDTDGPQEDIQRVEEV